MKHKPYSHAIMGNNYQLFIEQAKGGIKISAIKTNISKAGKRSFEPGGSITIPDDAVGYVGSILTLLEGK